MIKKIPFVSTIGAFLILSVLAPAQTAPTPARLSAPALGVLEGMLDFCGKVNPQSADKYKEIRKNLTKDQAAGAVDKMRNSQEYKDSVDQVTKQLAALPTKEASATCQAKAK